MKNIQVIDGANNCTYDVYAIEADSFNIIFPCDTDIEFAEDFYNRVGEEKANSILNPLWEKRLNKKDINGIHGTLFYGLIEEKKKYYPTKKEDEMLDGFVQ